MSEGKKFSREYSIYVAGEIISKALTFLLLPLYGAYLSLEDFAILQLVAMLWPVVVILLGKGFSSYIIRGYFEYPDKKAFLGTYLIFSMGIGCIIASGIHLAGPWFFGFIFRQTAYKPYLQYGVFFAVFRLFFDHVISFYRARREPKISVSLSILQFFTQAFAVCIAVFVLKSDLRGILNAQLIGFGLTAVVFLFIIRPEVSFRFQSSIILPGISFVAPLYVHGLASWAIIYISRIFIERAMSMADLAVFSAATQFALIVSVINNGLNQAWLPFIFSNADREDFVQLFTVNARKVLIFISLLGGTLILFSREILLLMKKTAYLSAQTILPLLIAGYVFQMLYYMYTAPILYHKKTKLLPVISLSAGLICVLINVFGVPLWGTMGAALSTIVSFLVMFLIVRYLSKRFIKMSLLNIRLILFLLIIAIILLVSYIGINSLPLWIGVLIKILLITGVIKILEWLDLINVKIFIMGFLKQ
jgi:O-antigen/teichoic acid export membrane protein